MSAITYYTASGQSAFNAATTIGDPVWQDAIEGQNAKLVFLQPFMQLAVSYSPLALNTQYPAQGTSGVPATPTYYLVSEEGFSDVKAGLMTWNRKYARVPDQSVETEEFAYTYPGFVIPITAGAPAPIASITHGVGANNIMITTTLTGVSAGNQVYISCSYARNSATYAIQMFVRTVSASAGNSVGIPMVLPGTGDFVNEAGTVQLASAGRTAPRTMVVGSRILVDYALATADTLESSLALPIVDPFTPIDAYGNEVNMLSTGTATKPNIESYQQWVKAGAEIIAEPSTRSRWLGNIFARRTRLVPAR